MIVYKCPNCKSKLENPESLGGTQDKCPGCGLVHTVPYVRPKTETSKPVRIEPKPVPSPTIQENEPLPLPRDHSGQSSKIVKVTFSESILSFSGIVGVAIGAACLIAGIAFIKTEFGFMMIITSIALPLACIIPLWMSDLLSHLRQLIFEVRELQLKQNNR